MKIGFLIDPPQSFLPDKDSSIELMRAAQAAGDEVIMFEADGMLLGSSGLRIEGKAVDMLDSPDPWYRSRGPWSGSSSELGLIMLRLEPPVTSAFRYACAMLELASAAGTPVINKPASVLEREEKIAALAYPSLVPPTLIGSDWRALADFASGLSAGCAVKPLNSMGGEGIFAFAAGDSNIPVAIRQLVQTSGVVVVQERIADLASGDRRVFVIDGKPSSVMLNRLPASGSHLANMAAGGKPVAMPLGEAEQEIGLAVGSDLKQAGILFAGIDVIGGLLTEINISCPTGIVQVRVQTGEDLAGEIIALARKAAAG